MPEGGRRAESAFPSSSSRMLPKVRRLRSADIPIVAGRRVVVGFLSAKTSPNTKSLNRYAVIIGSAGRTAVVRHRIKRIVWAAIDSWPNTGRDVIIFFAPRPSTPTAADIRAALAELEKSLH